VSEAAATAEKWAELLAQPYSVENQTKITKLLSPGKEDWEQVATEVHFESATLLLSTISSKIVGKPMTLAHSYASAVLGKVCLTAMSASAIYRGHEAGNLPTLDHSSIAILSRTIIESAIMYWYLADEVNDEEWRFRLQVLKIHDSAARVRFWKAIMPEEADKERLALNELRDELKEMPLFRGRAEQARASIRGGQTVYVNGMRSVVKAMGIDEEYYDGTYNYLSAQAHATPISYFRDSEDPAAQIIWSRVFSQYCLHHALQMMLRVALKEISLSQLEAEFDGEELGRFRKMIISKLKPIDGLQAATPEEMPIPGTKPPQTS
jgi:hypothetical protein